uniref:Reverse transcriptase/retrotransposon-derived protein RNase H-like domain-containing protein n=1 Tax=Cyanoderma ruficeps TaxID=181631 RepID=A0A8C3NZ51_9PASS
MICFYQGNRKRWLKRNLEHLKRKSWTKEGEQNFKKFKDKLLNAPVVALPDSEKEFELYVYVKQSHAKGILVQEHGKTRWPVAYFSKPLARGWPHCLQNCAPTNLMVTEAQKLTMGEYLICSML